MYVTVRMERTDAEKHASYVNLVESIMMLRRGDVLPDEWIAIQIKELKWLRYYYDDMSQIHLDIEDTLFREKAEYAETCLSYLLNTWETRYVLDQREYLRFCETLMDIMEVVDEEEELIHRFDKCFS